MPVEIKVGQPVITNNHGSIFMVNDQQGEIDPESEQGVFAGDTRFISFYQLYINGARWQLLSVVMGKTLDGGLGPTGLHRGA